MNSERFFRKNLPYLELDEIANIFFLGTYYGAIQKKWDICYWSVGGKGSCAIQIPPEILVLGNLNAYECDLLARGVSGLNFPGFFAPSKCAVFLHSH